MTWALASSRFSRSRIQTSDDVHQPIYPVIPAPTATRPPEPAQQHPKHWLLPPGAPCLPLLATVLAPYPPPTASARTLPVPLYWQASTLARVSPTPAPNSGPFPIRSMIGTLSPYPRWYGETMPASACLMHPFRPRMGVVKMVRAMWRGRGSSFANTWSTAWGDDGRAGCWYWN
jgi:hypothetical protein